MNVFREDDRASRAILRFAGPLKDDLPRLIHALFFARWCNRQSSLDALSPSLLESEADLVEALSTLPPPWSNVTAYPVEPCRWGDRLYSRWETATHLLRQVREELAELVLSANGNVIEATKVINDRFRMTNDFPIFMAIMDIAWFRPDVMDPASPVPTGIGAAPFLDLLQQHLGLANHTDTCTQMIQLQAQYWPEARRALQPIDVEYLSCECRKYWSYKNGTKHFEGKNVFRRGQDPKETFDIAPQSLMEPLETEVYVIAGGPCSGKTTLLERLQAEQFSVLPEGSRLLIEQAQETGRTIEEVRADPVAWQRRVCQKDFTVLSRLDPKKPIVSDTSFIENLVFCDQAGLVLGPHLQQWVHNYRYKMVFFLAPLEDYESTPERLETPSSAAQISAQILRRYRDFGYEPVLIPAGSVESRLETIRGLLPRVDQGV